MANQEEVMVTTSASEGPDELASSAVGTECENSVAKENGSVAADMSREGAGPAVNELQRADFDPKKLSVLSSEPKMSTGCRDDEAPRHFASGICHRTGVQFVPGPTAGTDPPPWLDDACGECAACVGRTRRELLAPT
jgi:hypothetical protein